MLCWGTCRYVGDFKELDVEAFEPPFARQLLEAEVVEAAMVY